MTEFQMLLQHLKQPEYLHVLINPLPVYASIAAITALFISTLWLQKHAQLVSLILVVIACVSVWPVVHYGQAAYESIYAMSDPAARQWLDLHMQRAEQFQYLFYASALVALAGIVAVWQWPRALKPLCWTTLAMTLASISVAGWISHAGGQVRHPEFREGPPPNPVAHEEEHEHGSGEKEHGVENGKAGEAQAMDHGATPGMKMDGEEGEAQSMQHDATGQAAAPDTEQIEASRLQLEASRLQLEASRKQLEAEDAAKGKMASPAPAQTQPGPAADGHGHDHKPKP